MPTKKTPKILCPAQIPIDSAMNPLGIGIPEILARLRCFDPDCPCHFPEGKVHCPRRLHLDQTPNFSVIDGPEGPIGQCHVVYLVYLFETERMTCSTEKLREALTRALTMPDEEAPPPVIPKELFSTGAGLRSTAIAAWDGSRSMRLDAWAKGWSGNRRFAPDATAQNTTGSTI